MQKLIDIVDNFKGKKIGVIGDLMLDQFIFGNVERISPEAPVPVVLFSKELYILGGAANTANNITSLGGEVALVGVVGEDAAANHFFEQLKASGINGEGIVTVKNKSTTQKIRIVAQGQHIVRVDKEEVELISKEVESQVLATLEAQIKTWDMVVVSDYNKGFLTENLILNIIALAKKHGKRVVADIKPNHLPYFENVFLVVPNQKEAFLMSGVKEVAVAGKILQEKLHANVLLKQASEGMTLFEGDEVSSFATRAKEVFDVSGAGDTVLATLSLALCAGATLKEAAIIANHAAGISVAKVGTAVVLPEELKRDLRDHG